MRIIERVFFKRPCGKINFLDAGMQPSRLSESLSGINLTNYPTWTKIHRHGAMWISKEGK